jgi:amidase
MPDPSRRTFLGLVAGAALAPSAGRATMTSSFPPATALAADIAARRISSLEAVERAISRIEALDGRINAVVVRDFDRARAAARATDEAIGRGERRPLLGVPMTVKESYNVAGLPTTWGMPGQSGWIPGEDAAAVARLKRAGAIILGKTNLPFQMGSWHSARVPLLLHDWQSFNPVYGTTNNPWDLSRTPGGSSGGAGAALAAGYVPLELGSDIGGSIRAPAHFCGVYGHKPTVGLVPGRGHVPPHVPALPEEPNLAVCGPMARTAADLATALAILAGPDFDNAAAYSLRLPPPRHERLRDYRVLMIDTHPLMPSSQGVRSLLDRRAQALEEAGVRLQRSSPLLPDLAASARAYMEALSAFDAAGWPEEAFSILRRAADALDPADDSLAAHRLRGALLSAWALTGNHWQRGALRAQWRRFFESFDVLLCPIMPTAAFPHDHGEDQEARRIEIDGRAYPYLDQLFWPGVATYPGLPATVAPIGLAEDGLPAGIQIVGPWLEDRTTIAFAALMEESFGGAPRPPPNV